MTTSTSTGLVRSFTLIDDGSVEDGFVSQVTLKDGTDDNGDAVSSRSYTTRSLTGKDYLTRVLTSAADSAPGETVETTDTEDDYAYTYYTNTFAPETLTVTYPPRWCTIQPARGPSAPPAHARGACGPNPGA